MRVFPAPPRLTCGRSVGPPEVLQSYIPIMGNCNPARIIPSRGEAITPALPRLPTVSAAASASPPRRRNAPDQGGKGAREAHVLPEQVRIGRAPRRLRRAGGV